MADDAESQSRRKFVQNCVGLASSAGVVGLLLATYSKQSKALPAWALRPPGALPEEDFLCGWLEANKPGMSPPAILHGDYSPFNVMVAPDLPARLAAIVDWDTGTIGDPLLDIGHLLARWVEPGEAGPLGPQAGDLASYPTRSEMAARYAERSGRDLSALPYYECLALFKLGVILEGTYARQQRAGVPDARNTMTDTVPRLFRSAAAFARGELT